MSVPDELVEAVAKAIPGVAYNEIAWNAKLADARTVLSAVSEAGWVRRAEYDEACDYVNHFTATRDEARAQAEALQRELDDQRQRLEPDGAGGFRWSSADNEARAERAERQADALAEALRFVHAVLGANHLTLGASHGFDACGLCAAETKTQDALRAFRESKASV
jgi:hypothetical protein